MRLSYLKYALVHNFFSWIWPCLLELRASVYVYTLPPSLLFEILSYVVVFLLGVEAAAFVLEKEGETPYL